MIRRVIRREIKNKKHNNKKNMNNTNNKKNNVFVTLLHHLEPLWRPLRRRIIVRNIRIIRRIMRRQNQ